MTWFLWIIGVLVFIFVIIGSIYCMIERDREDVRYYSGVGDKILELEKRKKENQRK